MAAAAFRRERVRAIGGFGLDSNAVRVRGSGTGGVMWASKRSDFSYLRAEKTGLRGRERGQLLLRGLEELQVGDQQLEPVAALHEQAGRRVLPLDPVQLLNELSCDPLGERRVVGPADPTQLDDQLPDDQRAGAEFVPAARTRSAENVRARRQRAVRRPLLDRV